MKREERKKIFLWAKIIALTVGLVLATVYQFAGVSALALVSLAFFAAAFLMMAVTEIEQLLFLQNLKIEAQTEEENQAKTKELRHNKLVAAVKMLLSGGMAVFTVVVMCLF